MSGSGATRLVVTSSAVLAMLLGLTVLAAYDAQGKDPVVARPGTRLSARIVVQNQVVVSSSGTQPDKTPVYLSSQRVPRCADQQPSCMIAGSKVVDGSVLTAECFAFGAGMTNMDLRVLAARRNPERVSSDLWYGVRAPDGSLGFVSEVYLTTASRGGLGLRQC